VRPFIGDYDGIVSTATSVGMAWTGPGKTYGALPTNLEIYFAGLTPLAVSDEPGSQCRRRRRLSVVSHQPSLIAEANEIAKPGLVRDEGRQGPVPRCMGS
jgi:hypothetical protein